MANVWDVMGTFFQILPKSVTLPKVYNYLDSALELNPNSAHAHYVKALVSVWSEFDWVKGEEEFLTSLRLNPNDALCRMYYAHLLISVQRSEEAVIQANLALELDPSKPLILGLYGVVMTNEGNEQSAIEHFEKAISIDPNFGFAIANLNAIYMLDAYKKGDFERWIKLWNQKVIADGWWNETCREYVIKVFHERGFIAALEEMFRVDEIKECPLGLGVKVERYIMLENYDKAMDYIEEAYENRNMGTAYIATNLNLYNQLKDNPRYIALLKKMNLPYE